MLTLSQPCILRGSPTNNLDITKDSTHNIPTKKSVSKDYIRKLMPEFREFLTKIESQISYTRWIPDWCLKLSDTLLGALEAYQVTPQELRAVDELLQNAPLKEQMLNGLLLPGELVYMQDVAMQCSKQKLSTQELKKLLHKNDQGLSSQRLMTHIFICFLYESDKLPR